MADFTFDTRSFFYYKNYDIALWLGGLSSSGGGGILTSSIYLIFINAGLILVILQRFYRLNILRSSSLGAYGKSLFILSAPII